MEENDTDTDTSLALLASLLEPAIYPLEELIDALTDANGDVASAAEAILLPRIKSSGKRKAGTGLESWLGRKKPKDLPIPQTPPKVDGAVLVKQAKPSTDLLSVLRQASSSTSKPKTVPQPAVQVSSQASIDTAGLPVTILESPLSPAFASALYHAMMEESAKWESNKWYLAGRWVESPHLMTSYARHGDPTHMSRIDAKYYYSGTEQKSAPVGHTRRHPI